MYMVDSEVHGIVEVECGSLHLGHCNNQLLYLKFVAPVSQVPQKYQVVPLY